MIFDTDVRVAFRDSQLVLKVTERCDYCQLPTNIVVVTQSQQVLRQLDETICNECARARDQLPEYLRHDMKELILASVRMAQNKEGRGV
jgi:superfamily II helicase